MAAFRFSLSLGQGLPPQGRVLKIADFLRPDGSGYLTLTFQLRLGPDLAEHRAVAEAFQRLAAFASRPTGSLARPVRQGFDSMLVHGPGLSEGEVWYTAEVDIYYSGLRGRVRELVEGAICPGWPK
jgi:hypothetical protein